MNVGLLHEISGVVFGEALHPIDGHVVLEHVLRRDSVSRGPLFHLENRGELVVDDVCSHGGTAVDVELLAVVEVGGDSALVELRGLDGVGGGCRSWDQVGGAV